MPSRCSFRQLPGRRYLAESKAVILQLDVITLFFAAKSAMLIFSGQRRSSAIPETFGTRSE